LSGFATLNSRGEKRQVQRTLQLKCCARSSIQRGGVAFVQAIRLRPSKCFPRRARSGFHSPKIKWHLDLVTYFESLSASDDPKAPIFTNLYRKSPGSHGGLSNAFARLMHLAGIRAPLGPEKQGKGRQFRTLGFHSLRHSFSTLANSEVPVDVRKEIVGHSSEDIHRRYVHLHLMLQEKAIANLPSLF
jgi:integrase